MKKLLYITICSLAVLGFTGCNDELNDELFHKFTYLSTNGWQTINAEINEDDTAEIPIYFGVNGTSANDKDIVLRVENDTDTLAGYNFDRFKKQTYFYYSELPTSSYSYDKEFYVIPKGELKGVCKVKINTNDIADIYNNYVLPIKISASQGEIVGEAKYSKLLANVIFLNKYSGDYSGSGKITIEGKSQSSSVGSAKLYASSHTECYMYAANVSSTTDPSYKLLAINISIDEFANVTMVGNCSELEFVPITSTLTRKYSLHRTDSRYYIQTAVLTLKYKYKDQNPAENRTLIYEGTHTQVKNVLKVDYPDVVVSEN